MPSFTMAAFIFETVINGDVVNEYRVRFET